MRAKVAKRLRRTVYGEQSLRQRGYQWVTAFGEPRQGFIVADDERRAMQAAKRAHVAGQ